MSFVARVLEGLADIISSVKVNFYNKSTLLLSLFVLELRLPFFLDIFNQIFKINDVEIMMFFDIKGKVWFGLRDIIKVLNYSNIEKAITTIKISNINKKIYENLEPPPKRGGFYKYN